MLDAEHGDRAPVPPRPGPHLRVRGAASARADGWIAALAGGGLALMIIANVVLAQGLGKRCDTCYLAGTEYVLATLRGGSPATDFAQDLLGAQRVLEGRDAYPILDDAQPEVDVEGLQASHVSTHPPTAFLFGLPLVGLSWPEAARRWALWMLLATIVAWRAAGLGWPAALALAAWGLAWPTLALSLGQLTPVWLLGQALAWRWRRTPWLAGAALGVASLTKILPALLLVPFVLRRQWAALSSFAAVWGAAIGLLVWLAPGSVADYLRVAVPTAAEQAHRLDNGAIFAVAALRVGLPAPVLAGLLLVAVAARAMRATLGASVLERRTWSLWVWLTVALLPIAWQASLLPLTTELILVARTARLLPRILAGAAVAASLLLPWDGHLGRNGEGVVLCLVATGLALVVHHVQAGPLAATLHD